MVPEVPDLTDVKSVLLGNKWQPVLGAELSDLQGWVRLRVARYDWITVRLSRIDAVRTTELPDQPVVHRLNPWEDDR